MPIPDLPLVDRHCVDIAASDERVWAALSEVLQRGFGGVGFAQLAHFLGAEERKVQGSPLSPGSTIVGFRVLESDPPRKAVLSGRHRFSNYLLTIEIGNGTLCATTNAHFPGFRGSVYRRLLLGSGAHVVSMRRILDKVKRRAERSG